MEFFPAGSCFPRRDMVSLQIPKYSQWIVYFYVFLHLPVKYQNLVWASKDKTTDKFESKKISDMRPCLCLNEKPHGIVSRCFLLSSWFPRKTGMFVDLGSASTIIAPVFEVGHMARGGPLGFSSVASQTARYLSMYTYTWRICIWCIHTSKCIYCARGWIMHQLRRW